MILRGLYSNAMRFFLEEETLARLDAAQMEIDALIALEDFRGVRVVVQREKAEYVVFGWWRLRYEAGDAFSRTEGWVRFLTGQMNVQSTPYAMWLDASHGFGVVALRDDLAEDPRTDVVTLVFSHEEQFTIHDSEREVARIEPLKPMSGRDTTTWWIQNVPEFAEDGDRGARSLVCFRDVPTSLVQVLQHRIEHSQEGAIYRNQVDVRKTLRPFYSHLLYYRWVKPGFIQIEQLESKDLYADESALPLWKNDRIGPVRRGVLFQRVLWGEGSSQPDTIFERAKADLCGWYYIWNQNARGPFPSRYEALEAVRSEVHQRYDR